MDDRVEAMTFNGMLLISGGARSAFASFGYDLCNGHIDLTGKLPVNYIAGLKKAYVEGFWGGAYEHFGLDSEGYPLAD